MSFSSLPSINLSTAPSSHCTLQSAVFVRALLQAISVRDIEAIHNGFDKALQLSLGDTAGNNSNENSDYARKQLSTKAFSSPSTDNAFPPSAGGRTGNANVVSSNIKLPPTSAGGGGASAVTLLGSSTVAAKSSKIPHPPPQGASASPAAATAYSPARSGTRSLAGSPSGKAFSMTLDATANQSSDPNGAKSASSGVGAGGAGTVSNASQNKQQQQQLHHHQEVDSFVLLDPSTLRHPQALPFSASLLTATHPTLSLYSDWLFFCHTHGFSVLQTQHCLILLSELLETLASQVDPESPSGSASMTNSNAQPQHGILDASSSTGNPHEHHLPSPARKNAPPTKQHGNLNGGTGNNSSTNNNNINNNNDNSSQISDHVSSFFSSQPPECLIETLAGFLSRSCQRKKILVIDEDKVNQVASDKEKSEQDATLLAAQLQPQANQTDGKRGGAGGGGGGKGSKSQSSSAHGKSVTKHPLSHSGGEDSGNSNRQKAIDQGNNYSGNSKSDSDAFGQSQTNLLSAAAYKGSGRPQLVDPNPYVKEITIDPIFNTSEVRAICAFANETILPQWRLVSVVQRNPDGLTLPITRELIVETLPVALPSLQSEGTVQKTYLDTQARLRAFAEASKALHDCYADAMAERSVTIRAEYDRSTSVALRRDKTMRDDDSRKQMRPEEFKRTVKVLARVMERDTVMKQLAVNPVALNQDDEATAILANKTQEQMLEYVAALREEQLLNSLGSASPGSTVNTSYSVSSAGTGGRGNANRQQQTQRGSQQQHVSPSTSTAQQQQQQQQQGQRGSTVSGSTQNLRLQQQQVESDVAENVLTLERRLERLEQAAVVATQQLEKQNSPGGHSNRRSHHR